MSRLDEIHGAVKNALIKDGWEISDDPLTFVYKGQRILIDLAAEKIFFAEKESRKIAVEVKSFLSNAKMNELYGAVGQYDVYSVYLEEYEPTRKLFLGVSREIYRNFLKENLFKLFWIKRKYPFW